MRSLSRRVRTTTAFDVPQRGCADEPDFELPEPEQEAGSTSHPSASAPT
jgi:hypothetical protein